MNPITAHTNHGNQANTPEGVPPSGSPQGSLIGKLAKPGLISLLEKQRVSTRYKRVFEDESLGAVVYAAPIPDSEKISAQAFIGRQLRPSFHYTFRNAAQAQAYWEDWHQKALACATMKAAQQHARAQAMAQPHGLSVGDVLVASWGYEQTNIDYYQVTRLVGKRSVEIRKIGQNATTLGWEQGECTPCKDHYISTPMVKRVGENDRVKVQDWGVWARKLTPIIVDGKEVFRALRWTSYY